MLYGLVLSFAMLSLASLTGEIYDKMKRRLSFSFAYPFLFLAEGTVLSFADFSLRYFLFQRYLGTDVMVEKKMKTASR